ncbi:Alpha/beta-Hydrolases superfamily protein [Gossypium australe]|uniref:Alpha/beta-Hydrolases superfamily protein n=1 Tax=Gossypium australe TaxID=47621 RepID=A0A5B6W6B6_9ROSI|nr:Alpha/beta-Hydrolases superfamily protein [Gossypium australe]
MSIAAAGVCFLFTLFHSCDLFRDPFSRESEGSFQYGNYYREADDLRAVIQHFSGENRVVSAILGHRKGGIVVLLYASKYQDIHIVVNVSGRYDLKRGIAERLGEDFMEIIKKDGHIDVKNKTGGVEYRVTEEALMDSLRTDMHEACLKIDKECLVLTVHGSADEINSVEDALEFAKVIPNHQLHIIGANHGYTSHQTELASTVVKFIKSALVQDKVEAVNTNLKFSPATNEIQVTAEIYQQCKPLQLDLASDLI